MKDSVAGMSKHFTVRGYIAGIRAVHFNRVNPNCAHPRRCTLRSNMQVVHLEIMYTTELSAHYFAVSTSGYQPVVAIIARGTPLMAHSRSRTDSSGICKIQNCTDVALSMEDAWDAMKNNSCVAIISGSRGARFDWSILCVFCKN